MIYTVTLNPALDKTVTIPGFTVDSVNRISGMRTDAGGKGINVSKWIKALGGESVALGILGGMTGQTIRRFLENEGIEADFTYIENETRINLKITDPDQGTHTDVNEPGAFVDAETAMDVYRRLTARIRAEDLVVLAGSLPPGLPEGFFCEWISMLSGIGAKVYLDVDGPALASSLTARPYFVKPNLNELEQLMKRKLPSLPDICSAISQILANGTRRVVISMGAQGAIFAEGTRRLYAKGLHVPVDSTVGAGDAMVAAMALLCSQGQSMEDMIPFAIAAGASGAMQSGTQTAPLSLVASLAKQVEWESIT